VQVFLQVKPAGGIAFDTLDDVFIASAYHNLGPNDFDIWLLTKKKLSQLPISTKMWESQPSVTLDGKDLYFAHNSAKNMHQVTIAVTHPIGTSGWSSPVDLGPRINFCDYVASPFIADDGKTLFFSANRSGIVTIYVSTKGMTDTSWSEPVRLPLPINNANNSLFPFLSRDHKTFYFSSDRPGGKGGFDLYEVKLPRGLKSLYDKMVLKW
jgi:hypothetical protein